MFGLELLALVPFVGVIGLLQQKVSAQQSIINKHEDVIQTQQEVLEALTRGRGKDIPLPFTSSSRLAGLMLGGGLLCVAGMVVRYRYWPMLSDHTTRPPAHYSPTRASFETEECCACRENKKDTILLPCRHLSLCWSCAERMRGHGCPMCRQPIRQLQFVYVT